MKQTDGQVVPVRWKEIVLLCFATACIANGIAFVIMAGLQYVAWLVRLSAGAMDWYGLLWICVCCLVASINIWGVQSILGQIDRLRQKERGQ